MIETLTAIMGMPRSGTSWVGQIFDSAPDVAYRLEPIFSYAFKNAVDERSTAEELERFFEAIHASQDAFMLQLDRRRSGGYPTFAKTGPGRHLVWKTTRFHNLLPVMLERCPRLRVVSVLRHPCGAIHSWLKAPREFPPALDPLVEWRSGRCRKTAPSEFWGFDDWKAVTALHVDLARRYPARMLFVDYEELVARPLEGADRLLRFAGIATSPQTRAFVESCHRRHDDDPYAVFKDPARAKQWQQDLQPAIRDAILAELEQPELRALLAAARQLGSQSP